MSQSLISIGTIEAVALPDYGLSNIPAKVDTGADSSAIWASNILEVNHELTFVLFGPSSPYFTGEEIKTKKYSFVTVKNSFGHIENRYKVNMRIQLAERIIKVKVTLANRSNNRFPILIGRRTLKRKFVVDVSKKTSAINNQRILMLSSKRTGRNLNYVNYLEGEGLNVAITTYEDLIFRLGGDGNRIAIASSGEDLASYSLVYFLTVYASTAHSDVSAAIAEYLDNRNIDYIDRGVNQCPDPSKLYQYVSLADNNIQIPKTIFALPHRLSGLYEKIVAELGLPFILKNKHGRRGIHNYLIESKNQFDRILRQTEDLGIWLLAQQYIANDFDYRLLIAGGQVCVILRRTRLNNGTHLNNVSQGAKAELVDLADLPAKLINNATAAAKLMKLQIAGVDIVQDKQTKLWYCLEVNSAPQISSGAFTEEKQAAVAKYLSQRML